MVSAVLHEFEDPPRPLKIDATRKKNSKTSKCVVFKSQNTVSSNDLGKNIFSRKVKSQCLEFIKIMLFRDYSGIWRELVGLNDGFRFFSKK